MEKQNPPENRNINTGGANYNEKIEGHSIQGNVYKNKNIYNNIHMQIITQVVSPARPEAQGGILATFADKVTLMLRPILHNLRLLKRQDQNYQNLRYTNNSTVSKANKFTHIQNFKNQDWKCIGTLQGHIKVLSVNISSVHNILISADSVDRKIKIWDIKKHQLLYELLILESINSISIKIKSVAISPDNTILAIATNIGTIELWKLEEILNSGNKVPYDVIDLQECDTSMIFCDSEFLACSLGRRNEAEIQLWMVDVAQKSRPISKFLICQDEYYDYASNQPEEDYLWINKRFVCLAFSHDGRKLAAGFAHSSDDQPLDENIKIWDFFTKKIEQTLSGHSGQTTSIAFSPNGSTLASGGFDNKVRLWNIKDGKEICPPLEGHHHPVRSVTFSPDGGILASGSDDGTIRLWNPLNGEQLCSSLKEHTGSVSCVAFTHDGQTLISGSSDGTIKFWQYNYK